MSEINPAIEESWKKVLIDEFQKPYFKQIKQTLLEEKSKYRIYPPGNLIFNAFNQTPFENLSVVILGQDPYHGPGQAHGLCFSVPQGITQPPSLINIFKEIHNDLGIAVPKTGNLEKWAKQGVLLLNAMLSVRENNAGSHQKIGWETFTNQVIQTISDKRDGIIFLLWGRFAQEKAKLIDTKRHTILTAAHPSPLSAYNGFFGCKHFSKTNEILKKMGKKPIDWSII
ncbi:MAG TPA: uracil-DNA glycosylase [Chitinispirillaceae bacterium]|nr:uracil-DNA glycosylase [Chitinispirillaceae bacterium]